MKPIYAVGSLVFVLVAASVGYLLFSSPVQMEELSIEQVLEETGGVPSEEGVVKKALPKPKGVQYKEIVKPAGFVNTGDQPIKIADYVGKKVILLDVMTYSCINCQRTFPFVTAWYEKYKDDGFIAIGIHTPEFAFEKNKANVEKAMKEFGIDFPVVLDNDYGTWNAYGNRYWPRKYLIDIYGNIAYDHIGEGAYEETEMKIRELLAERAQVLSTKMPDSGELAVSGITETTFNSKSPETYFGSARNEYLANGNSGKQGKQTFSLPTSFSQNALYLGGEWNIQPEYAETDGETSVVYKYNAKEVYIVAESDSGIEMEVLQDGKPVGASAGADVRANGSVLMKESRLYKLIQSPLPGEHLLELRIKGRGLRLYAFTFG